jgi:hypothetical protein
MSPPLVQAAPEEPIVREENFEDREDEQEIYLSVVEDDDVADATLNGPIESEDSEEVPIEFMSFWCHELNQSRYESRTRWATTCTIGSSIYKNLKLKKRKKKKMLAI